MLITLMKTKIVPQVTLNRKNSISVGMDVTIPEDFGDTGYAGKRGIVREILVKSGKEMVAVVTDAGIVWVERKWLEKHNTKSNEQGWPEDYHCNFLEPGIASYEDTGAGIALLKKETIDDWIQTFKNKPVIIEHQDVNPKNFKEKAVGYITNVYYNAETGWYDCDFIITDDEGHRVINDGWSVSCSFDVVDTLPGGEWHANKYTEEITKGEGLHLALVTSPRYEDCRITKNNQTVRFNSKEIKVKANEQDLSLMSTMALDKYLGALSDVGLQTVIDGDHDEAIKKVAKLHMGDRARKKEEELLASAGDKSKENMVTLTRKKEDAKMWGLFAKKKDKASIENDKIDATKVFVKVDEEMVPLSTLMNSVGDGFELLQETDTIKINEKDISIKDLVNAYKATKKNNDDDEDKEKKEDDADKKKDDDDADKKNDDDDEDKEVKDDAKLCCYRCGKKLNDEEKKFDDGCCNECFPEKKADDKGKKADDEGEDIDKDKDIKNKKQDGKKFFIDLENARKTPIDNKGPVRGGADTREDRAARGKKYFGSKKKE